MCVGWRIAARSAIPGRALRALLRREVEVAARTQRAILHVEVPGALARVAAAVVVGEVRVVGRPEA